MDKVIEEEVTATKRKKTILVITITAGLLVAAILLLRFTLKTSVKKSAITTAVVETGNIENTIDASGEVLPEFEEVISSPINASVQKVMLDAGSEVKAGQSVLTLDKTTAQAEFEKMKFQLESKRNDIRKLTLELDKSFFRY